MRQLIATIYNSLPSERERENFAIMLYRWNMVAYARRLLAAYEDARGTHGCGRWAGRVEE
jgi:hypothetical protein